MSMDDDGPFSTTMTKPKLKKPPMYSVIVLNDDFTPMEFVVKVLIMVFSLGLDDATRFMVQVHKEGRAKIGSYTLDVAETKVTQLVEMARKNQHPLMAFTEQV